MRVFFLTIGLDTRYDAPASHGGSLALKLQRGGAGGAERDRTANLRVANAALSQLSYGPGDAKR